MFGAALLVGVTVVSYLSWFPIEMNRPTTPQIIMEMDALRPAVIICSIAGVLYIDIMMLLGAMGMISAPGMTPLKFVIGNVAAVLGSLLVFSLRMPERKRLPITLCSYGFLLFFAITACTFAN
jgi:hypothetical protein